MFPFDVILFDVGGVLLTNGWDHDERAAASKRFGMDLPAFEARHALAYPVWERGASTITEYLNATVFYEPRSFSQDEFSSFMKSQSKVLSDGGLGILGEIAASDCYLVGALNNEARETNEYRFTTFALRRYFKVALSSCYLGLRKPDVAIFRRALDILGSPAERVLFIDDRAENAAASASAGMTAIVFKGASDLRRELSSLGVF
jgi:putative hydrolase of the HAD superfamily